MKVWKKWATLTHSKDMVLNKDMNFYAKPLPKTILRPEELIFRLTIFLFPMALNVIQVIYRKYLD